jgi:AraC-like DNA-binding protein
MLDLLLRGGAIGTMSAVATVLLLRAPVRRGPLAVAACVVLLSAYLIVSGPAAADLSDSMRRVLVFAATCAPLGFTWMMLELLTDPGQRRWPWLVVAVLTALTGVAAPLLPWLGSVRGILVLLLYLGLMALAAISDHDDLIAARRRFRRVFLVVMALLGVTISMVEFALPDSELPAVIFALQAAAFWALALMFACWALSDADSVFAVSPDTAPPVGKTGDTDLIARLNATMAEGLWQQEGLTIGALAQALRVPEHKLRITINQELGHRNFSTFINGHRIDINGHRIDAAKARLADPGHWQSSILEIAYDCGFASLGPFNKAFRAQTGQSPREFRANAGAVPVNSENTR